ncbi:SIS domain-containing protein [Alkalicoccus chagannorensis]|uniref:SIS domain-containing protein n=1 Tax=Alkalicoccus chagannorensis TaxID=427072 RepID=UPI0003FCDD34|nr:SIS domain-containing protein [Alkalicoccus chagannorensis]
MEFRYLDVVQHKLEGIKERQRRPLEQAVRQMKEVLRRDGMIHVFGTGHSHLLAEELFYRAGGLACIRPILIESLMLHESATEASRLEREPDTAASFMKEQPLKEGDMVIVVSTSGRNPVPIDVALLSREAGAVVLSVSSHQYADTMHSRHESGLFLKETADTALDNESAPGDAALTHRALDTGFGPTSTIIGAALLHSVIAETIDQLAETGHRLPLLQSGNVDGADAHNAELITRYRDRNELLR